jgi:WD40 repeat protein
MKLVTTQQIVRIALFWVLAASLISIVHAFEPAWTYTINESTISNVAVSSDGSTIIVAADSIWIFSKDGTLQKKEKYGDKVALTPSGRFAVSSFGGIIYFFSTPLTPGPSDPKKMTKMWDYEFSSPVRYIDITDSGSKVLVATQGLGFFIFSTETGKITSNASVSNALLRISHDGNRIVGIVDNTINIFNTNNAKVSKSYNVNTMHNPEFVLLSQTVPLIVFDEDTRIRSYDLQMGTEIWNATMPGNLNSLAMTPSGSYVVAGTGNGNISRYSDEGNLNWSYLSKRENSQDAGISNIALSKDGGVAAAVSNDGAVLILNEKGVLMESSQIEDRIRNIALSQDGSLLLLTSDNKIYAFFTGYLPPKRSSSPTVLKTKASEAPNTSGINITSPQDLTRKPVIPNWSRTTVPDTITEIPTQYSTIRTPKQSPSGLNSGILAIMAGIFLYYVRRH